MSTRGKHPRARVSSLTPPDGVPAPVSPEDELSIPIIVPDPAMARTRTPTDPPRMTAQDFARQVTIDRQRLERSLEHLGDRLDRQGDRIKDLGESCARFDERLKSIEDDRGEFESIAAFREWAVKRITHATGREGDNGAVGALKARVDSADSRRWSLVMFVLGLLATAGGVVFWAGTTVADLRSSVSHLRDDVTDLRALRRLGQPRTSQEPDR